MGVNFWKILVRSYPLVHCSILEFFTHLNTYTYKHVCTYVPMWISEIDGTKHETNKNWIQKLAASLFQQYVTSKNKWLKLGRINVDISDELEKQLRLKAVERFGGKKGDLSKAVQEAVKTWINKKQWSRPSSNPNNYLIRSLYKRQGQAS